MKYIIIAILCLTIGYGIGHNKKDVQASHVKNQKSFFQKPLIPEKKFKVPTYKKL